MKRRLLRYLAVLSVALVSLTFAANAESASNDTMKTATAISVDRSYTDNLSSSSDVDWYKFSLSEAGYISLSFTHDYIESSSTYWRAYLYTAYPTEVTDYYFSGKTTTSTGGNIGLPAGTYYLKITDSAYSSKNYSFKINFTASSAWETELNDSYSSADMVKVDKKYSGNLMDSGDADWYKIKIPAGGKQLLQFNHDYISSSSRYFKLYIYDSGMTKKSEYSYVGNVQTFSDSLALSAGTYYIKITSSSYSAVNYSFKIATPKITITAQPANKTAAVDATAKFTVKANSIVSLSYQWYYRKNADSAWVKCSNGTAATLSVVGKTYRDGYQYRCRVSNAYGNVKYSDLATLHVHTMEITAQPVNKTVKEGATAKFTVKATSDSKLSYQWYYRTSSSGSWSKSSNGTSSSLSIEGKDYRNGYQYRCKITDAKGNSIYTKAVTLTVHYLKISTQPASKTVAKDAAAKFTVKAKSDNKISYQWYYRTSSSGSWAKCSNGTASSLSVVGKSYRNGYQYRCKLTASGSTSIYSKTVTLKVSK